VSEHQSTGLSIAIYKPTIGAGTYAPAGEYLHTLTNEYSSLTFTIAALGGYWEASFNIQGNLDFVEDWIANGLARHATIYDHAQNVCWDGFVNTVKANVGALSVTRGPLTDVANRVMVTFSERDTGMNPPTAGARAFTTLAQDATSISLYGIMEAFVEGGELDNGVGVTEADFLRDSYLEGHKLPETSKMLSMEQSTQPSVTVECAGYVHRLNYPYNQIVNAATITVSTKVGYVLDGDPGDGASIGDPNNIFTSANASIGVNGLLASRYENDSSLAWEVLKDIAARGDAARGRWLIGVYAGQRLVYTAAPDTLEYEQRLHDAHQRITAVSGAEVRPWNVLPGKWLMFTDFLIGRVQPTTLREDPRAMFIESMTYSAPYGLQLSGVKVGTLNQVMAQLGLGGVGA